MWALGKTLWPHILFTGLFKGTLRSSLVNKLKRFEWFSFLLKYVESWFVFFLYIYIYFETWIVYIHICSQLYFFHAFIEGFFTHLCYQLWIRGIARTSQFLLLKQGPTNQSFSPLRQLTTINATLYLFKNMRTLISKTHAKKLKLEYGQQSEYSVGLRNIGTSVSRVAHKKLCY